ncbi:Nudix hydrolase 2 [Glycine max]|nr:Nudix hydrolase 2 [Glycine max]
MMSSRACKPFSSSLLAASKLLLKSSSRAPPLQISALVGSMVPKIQGPKNSSGFPRSYMSATLASLAKEEEVPSKAIDTLRAVEDQHGGVIVNIEEPMDSSVFASLLEDSILQWREKGKKGVWIKLSREHSNLVDSAVKAGFRFHHAEPDYLMLVNWIPNTPDTLPANASHRVAVGAFVMNANREVLVVQESNGRFSGQGIWKLPTGGVDEGEDICTAAVREVKEETGIDTQFVEVIAFKERHKSFFRKSELFFVCMLQPHSFKIQRQVSEIEAAQWMAIEDYMAQPFVRENELFDFLTKIGLSKFDGKYNGFSTVLSSTSSRKKSYFYFNNKDAGHISNIVGAVVGLAEDSFVVVAIMTRKFDSIKDIDGTQETLCLVVRIIDLWVVLTCDNSDHLEMVIMDSNGDKILCVGTKDQFDTWSAMLREGNTYIMNNFRTLPNDGQYMICNHALKQLFTSGTTLKAQDDVALL